MSNNEKDLIKGILRHGPSILENVVVTTIDQNLENYITRTVQEHLDYPLPLTEEPTTRDWFIPNEYKEMDIEAFIVNKCPKENYQRVVDELDLYKKHGMLDVLKAMKYIVDTLRANNVVWGVGRGSSVSSYCLYLIGIHKIDSVKYDLPISEFFKGDENGKI
jgi:DNA polymerase III alpha subunit